jgi:chromate transporter
MSQLALLALSCLRVGTFVFGGGLVFIPLMEADVVQRFHWLTRQEFLDAVAMGQMTPGPLLVTATFIGYKVSGLLGAVVATLCIFLPSFLMTLLASHYVLALQGSARLKDFLWGVRAAVVGLVVAAIVSLAQGGVGTIWQGALCALALLLLFWRKLDGGLVIVGCGLVGVAMSQVMG